MSSYYVNDFDHKWIDSKAVIKQSQLGTPDLQSLTDLSTSIKIIQDMRIVPLSKHLAKTFLIAGIVRFIPILFFKFNINEIVVFIFKLVTGH
jgi:hypothetical protein